jgi:hypothetical protein
MIGHTGESHGAKVDGLEFFDLVEPVRGHHPAGLDIEIAVPIEGDPEAAACHFEDPDSHRHNLFPDPVVGDNGDTMQHATPIAQFRSKGQRSCNRIAVSLPER